MERHRKAVCAVTTYVQCFSFHSTCINLKILQHGNHHTSPVKLYTRKVQNRMKREAVNENVRFAALEKINFFRGQDENQT